MHHRHRGTLHHVFRRIYTSAWLVAACSMLVAAVSSNMATAITTISQSYRAEGSLPLGSIVSIIKDSADSVNAANINNAEAILGVVVSEDSSLLSLTNGQEQQVQVATGGIVQVLVSDINGEVKTGDQITASQINGVGMKATSNVKVVGTAQGGLDTANPSTQTYKDSTGQDKQVRIGQIPVQISVAYFFKEPEKTIIPSAIQNVANTIAGKDVRPLPIIVSMIIFFVALVAVGIIMYSMIRSSIISVGRNPMSQGAIYRNLLQISVLVLVILMVAVVSIYLVLTRF